MSRPRALRAYAEVVLGRQRSPRHETGDHMVNYLRAANVKDGELDLSDVKKMNFSPEEQSVFALAPGDVLITEGSGSRSAVGASAVWKGEIDGVVCFQNTLLRARPREGTDARFLAWWCRYAFGSGLFAEEATGANIFHLSAQRVRSIRMAHLQLAEQRAIADFLDTETARMDALITKKRRLITLLEERASASISSLLADQPLIPIRRIAHTLPGYMFASADFSADFNGPRLLRGINVALGSIRWDDTVRLSEGAMAPRRYQLRSGDVIIGMDRPFIGGGTRVAVVDTDSAGAFLVQRVCRLRTGSPDQAYLIRWALAGERFRRHVEADLTGVSVPHLSEDQIASFPVPAVGASLAGSLAAKIRVMEEHSSRLLQRLARQITLLQEKRQALITAAVTGELEIPGMAA